MTLKLHKNKGMNIIQRQMDDALKLKLARRSRRRRLYAEKCKDPIYHAVIVEKYNRHKHRMLTKEESMS